MSGFTESVAEQAALAWLESLGLGASVFRYPLHTRHPGPLAEVRADLIAGLNPGVRLMPSHVMFAATFMTMAPMAG